MTLRIYGPTITVRLGSWRDINNVQHTTFMVKGHALVDRAITNGSPLDDFIAVPVPAGFAFREGVGLTLNVLRRVDSGNGYFTLNGNTAASAVTPDGVPHAQYPIGIEVGDGASVFVVGIDFALTFEVVPVAAPDPSGKVG